MFRPLILTLALAAAPALANPHYQAEPAAKPAQARFAAKDIAWKCDDSGCSGAKGMSRPAIVCAALAREVGVLRSFSAGGQPLAPADLSKCNARARNAAANEVRTALKQ